MLDLPVDAHEGSLIAGIFDSLWIKNQDPATLIQNPIVYTDSIHFYFDTRIGDANKPFNDTFHVELTNLGINHIYNVFPSGGHWMYSDAAEAGFIFLDSIMDRHITSMPEEPLAKFKEFELFQNYPNPFNPTTTINFDLSKTLEATLKVYNNLGEEVTTLVSEQLSFGSHSFEWDASHYASGIYFYRLQAGNLVESQKMILIK
jgi:hypothetical protein